jgi:hypothetical protein
LPSDFLLPLFALTLLANAVLVAVAIRGLRRGRFDPDRQTVRTTSSLAPTSVGGDARPGGRGAAHDRPLTEELRRAIESRRAILDGAAAPSGDGLRPAARHPEAAAPDDSRGAAHPAATPDDPTEGATAPPPSPAPAAPRRRPRATTEPLARTATESPTGSSGRARGRRRFALPPMDDDHEKVSRSIETFLGGGEPAVGSPTAEAAATGATTVALLAVDGLPARPRRSKANRTGAELESVSSALAMVERTIRSAARGSDVVSAVDRGRYRVVLPATGELAARAYLRRIRATVEPLLESSERPLRLVVATATVLDEPIAEAVRRAERRLSAALAAAKAPVDAVGAHPDVAGPAALDPDALDPEPSPRAAGD